MLDYQALLYDPIYGVLGVPAVLEPSTGLTTAVDVTVIDETAGANVGTASSSKGTATARFGLSIETVRPACTVRMAELIANGLGRADLDMSLITFNGKSWRVRSHQLKPSPKGENDGEVQLILTESA